MRRGTQWPIGIGLVLVLTALGQIWFAVVASRDPSFAVEGDYYNKAINWNSELAQRLANDSLRWKIESTLQLGTGNGDGSLSISLRDSTGVGISGADVEVLAMHNARAARQLSARLTEVGAGSYRVQLPARRGGEWELRFVVRRGSQVFTARERLDAE